MYEKKKVCENVTEKCSWIAEISLLKHFPHVVILSIPWLTSFLPSTKLEVLLLAATPASSYCCCQPLFYSWQILQYEEEEEDERRATVN